MSDIFLCPSYVGFTTRRLSLSLQRRVSSPAQTWLIFKLILPSSLGVPELVGTPRALIGKDRDDGELSAVFMLCKLYYRLWRGQKSYPPSQASSCVCSRSPRERESLGKPSTLLSHFHQPAWTRAAMGLARAVWIPHEIERNSHSHKPSDHPGLVIVHCNTPKPQAA